MTGKTWLEHSPAWRSKAAAEGATAKRWNAWLSLSPDARKRTSQREYAVGKSVPVQTRAQAEKKAYEKLKAAAGHKARPATIRKHVQRMSAEELRKINELTPAEIVRRGSRDSRARKGNSIYWYN